MLIIRILQIALTIFNAANIILYGVLLGFLIDSLKNPNEMGNGLTVSFLLLLVMFSTNILSSIAIIVCVWKRIFLLGWSIFSFVITVASCLFCFLSKNNTFGFISLSDLVPILLLVLLSHFLKRQEYKLVNESERRRQRSLKTMAQPKRRKFRLEDPDLV